MKTTNINSDKSPYYEDTCKICLHPDRYDIEKFIVESSSYQTIIDAFSTETFELNKPNITYHKEHMHYLTNTELRELKKQHIEAFKDTIRETGRLYENLDDLGKYVLTILTVTPREKMQQVETVLKVVQAQMRILEYADKMDSLEGKKEADRGTKTISDLFRKERDKNA